MENKKKYHFNTYYTDEVLDELANSLFDWVNELARKRKFGMLGDWAYDNHFSPKNFVKYANKHEGFKLAYEWAKGYQEHTVSKGALTKEMDARFAIFFLGCNHEWKSKSTDDDGNLVNDFAQFVEYMNNKKKAALETTGC